MAEIALLEIVEAIRRMLPEEDDEQIDSQSLESVYFRSWTPSLPANHQIDLPRAIGLAFAHLVMENWESHLAPVGKFQMAFSAASPGSGKGCRPVVYKEKQTRIRLFGHGMVSRGSVTKEVEEEDKLVSGFVSPRLECFVLFRRN